MDNNALKHEGGLSRGQKYIPAGNKQQNAATFRLLSLGGGDLRLCSAVELPLHLQSKKIGNNQGRSTKRMRPKIYIKIKCPAECTIKLRILVEYHSQNDGPTL